MHRRIIIAAPGALMLIVGPAVTAMAASGTAKAPASGPVVLRAAAVADASGVVAQWHMDETNGTMNDSSGHGNDASRVRNVVQGVPGFSGTAFRFGRSSLIKVPDAATLDPGTSPFSVTLRFRGDDRPTVAGKDYDLLRKGPAALGAFYKVEIMRNGRALCEYGDSLNRRGLLNKGPDLTDGRWHTIRCSRTASGVSLTVDGRSWSKKAKLGTITNSTQLTIGAKPDGGDQTTGDLDEVTLVAG